MKRLLLRLCLVLTAVPAYAIASYGQLSLPAVFSDKMMFQQKIETPVWGKAMPGSTVSVSFRHNSAKAIADSSGKWMVRLPATLYGGPFELTIRCGKEKKEFRNVMVGEVWLCSGQSNMEMPLQGWSNGDGTYRYPVNHAEHEIFGAQYPAIRLLQLKPASSAFPQDNVTIIGDGWRECSPQSVKTFSAAAYFFAREVYQRTKIPVGLIASSVGGTTAELWTSIPVLKTMGDFRERIEKIEADTARRKRLNLGSLYNGMIAPLIPFGIKGVLWYQGEFSADRAYQYKELFPKMIEDWRNRWKQGDFPFYYVQLPITGRPDSINRRSTWAELREAQLQTLSVPNTAMAVTMDFTDNDLHPANKQDIGLRLAWIALGRDYGIEMPFSGPLYKDYVIENDAIRIRFSNPTAGLKTRNGDAIKGFYIAGSDSTFYPATVSIDGEELVVRSKRVSNPISVRYQWGNNPPGNLFSKWLLPASPFRTDNWEMITRNNK